MSEPCNSKGTAVSAGLVSAQQSAAISAGVSATADRYTALLHPCLVYDEAIGSMCLRAEPGVREGYFSPVVEGLQLKKPMV